MIWYVLAGLAVLFLALLYAARVRIIRGRKIRVRVPDESVAQEDPREAVRVRLHTAINCLMTTKALIERKLKPRLSARKSNELRNRLLTELAVAQGGLAELLLAVRPERSRSDELDEEIDDVTPKVVELKTDRGLPPIEDGACTICGKLPCRHYPEEGDQRTPLDMTPQCPRCKSYQVKKLDEQPNEQPDSETVWTCGRCGLCFVEDGGER